MTPLLVLPPNLPDAGRNRRHPLSDPLDSPDWEGLRWIFQRTPPHPASKPVAEPCVPLRPKRA